MNFANGGVVSDKVLNNSNDGSGGMTINISVTVQGGGQTSADVPRLQSSIRGMVVEELLKQQRPGGALNK